MRHGTLLAGPITFLAVGVVQRSPGGLLVLLAGRPDLLSPASRPAFGGAIPLPPIAPGADPDFLTAQPAIKDPVALFDGPSDRQTWAWTSAPREPILSGTFRWLSCRAPYGDL